MSDHERSPFETHHPHILGQNETTWCGGTQPPTKITFDREDLGIIVDVYDYEGYIHDEIDSEPLYSADMMFSFKPVNEELVKFYALAGLAHYANNEAAKHKETRLPN